MLKKMSAVKLKKIREANRLSHLKCRKHYSILKLLSQRRKDTARKQRMMKMMSAWKQKKCEKPID